MILLKWKLQSPACEEEQEGFSNSDTRTQLLHRNIKSLGLFFAFTSHVSGLDQIKENTCKNNTHLLISLLASVRFSKQRESFSLFFIFYYTILLVSRLLRQGQILTSETFDQKPLQ